jgi:hypothetical protein
MAANTNLRKRRFFMVFSFKIEHPSNSNADGKQGQNQGAVASLMVAPAGPMRLLRIRFGLPIAPGWRPGKSCYTRFR